MEKKSFVVLQIAHVDFRAERLNVRMLLNKQPAHVGKEKSPLRIMGIGISVGELVVNTVIANPLENVFLRR